MVDLVTQHLLNTSQIIFRLSGVEEYASEVACVSFHLHLYKYGASKYISETERMN